MRVASFVIRLLLACTLLLPLASYPAAAAGETVAFHIGAYAPGTIIVRTSERRLYLVLGNDTALRFPVGVGKAGKQWQGSAEIVAKFIELAGGPDAVIIYIPGGVPGNPIGAAAMVLTGGEYAIHGTNRPSSIGGYVSYGCIRMFNQDILSLYQRVSIGTPVVVMR